MNSFAFAHIADCHLGAWSSHSDLKDYPQIAFENAVNQCIDAGVSFIVISGDLFDTSIPSIDVMRTAASNLRRLKENGINVYAIAGSHDFSPTGKTLMSVLEEAGLIFNVTNSSVKDEKTNTEIYGMVGRRAGTEVDDFKEFSHASSHDGFRIFMMHSAIEEYRPKHMEDMKALPLSLVPKGFDYYANGHVHVKFCDNKMVFPGSLFPTSSKELEKYDCGFCIVNVNGKKYDIEWIDIKLCDVVSLNINADGKAPHEVEKDILENMKDVKDKIVLITVKGCMDGKISDIDFKKINDKSVELGARTLKRNTNKLTTKEFEEINKITFSSISELESLLIKENMGKINFSLDEEDTIRKLMKVLNDEKNEGETKDIFEERIKENAKKVLGLGE